MADAKTLVDTLIRSRRSGLAATAALGGLALVAGFAARALRQPASPGAAQPASDPAASAPTPFDGAEIGEDEARIMVRAMVAATLADGLLDETERKHLHASISAAGIAADGRAWLEAEMDDPADVDEIAGHVRSPEQAVRVYAATRLAIEADTLQEREFLKRLAEALDVPREAVARLDADLTG